jgi:hypothetical protein
VTAVCSVQCAVTEVNQGARVPYGQGRCRKMRRENENARQQLAADRSNNK